MPVQKFRVRGVDHKSEARLEEQIRRIEGVLFAVVNHEEECAEVEFEDDCVTPAEIRDAIAALGYEAEIAG